MTEQDGVSSCDSTVHSVKRQNKMVSAAVTVQYIASSDRTRLTKSELGKIRNEVPVAYSEVLSQYLDLAG